jgi:hypothetical protein
MGSGRSEKGKTSVLYHHIVTKAVRIWDGVDMPLVRWVPSSFSHSTHEHTCGKRDNHFF